MRKLLLCDSEQLPLMQACLSILTGAGEISAACDPRKNPRTLIRSDAQALGNIEFTQTAEEAKVKGRATYNDSDTSKAL